MDELITAASQIGFPILISLFLLVRFEKKLEELKYSIDKLSDKIEKLEIYETFSRRRNDN